MKKTIVFILGFFLISDYLEAQTISKHGFVVNGGIGHINSKVDKSGFDWVETKYRFGGSVGYRLRFKKQEFKHFHYDIDVNIGIKFLKPYKYFEYGYTSSGGDPVYYSSIGLTSLYSFAENLSAGFGLEPTYHIKHRNFLEKNKIDIPVVAKIIYDLKVVEIGISGKYGLFDVFETENQKSGKNIEVQFSVFIPLNKR